RFALAGLGLVAVSVFLLNPEASSGQVEAKLMHATTHSGARARLVKTFAVSESDLQLLSVTGAGLGSYGIATKGGGREAATRAKARLVAHPITHFGWFMDLAALGPIGFGIRMVAFLLLFLAIKPRRSSALLARWSGPAAVGAGICVYLFIAPSWLQGVSGAVLFGAATGFAIAKGGRSVAQAPLRLQSTEASRSSVAMSRPTLRANRSKGTSKPRPRVGPSLRL
ncbi:MAG: hypothetical protein AAFY60_15555, partial [Myxococcota bacterium]